MDSSLQGKHALVTGGGRGIGYAIAKDLLQHGACVSITGRSDMNAAIASLQRYGKVQAIAMDVADVASVEQGFARAAQTLGDIAVLVNNAGQASSASFLKTSKEQWQHMLNVNLNGTFHCSQQALPAMLKNGWGRIVNVASTAGLTGYAYVSAYCAAKHAVIGLTRSMALELATKGITVNAVCPGYTETDIVVDAIANIVNKTGCSEQQARAQLVAGNPQQRMVQPQEVAQAVTWLCMPGSAAMNGQAIAVSGGEVMA